MKLVLCLIVACSVRISNVQLCLIVLSVGFPNIRLCSIGKSFGCVGLSLITEPNKKSIERLRLGSITERLIDYAGDITHHISRSRLLTSCHLGNMAKVITF